MTETHNILPEWNTLSNECRDAMCRAVEFHGADSQAALEVYTALRAHLPQQRFPLFDAALTSNHRLTPSAASTDQQVVAECATTETPEPDAARVVAATIPSLLGHSEHSARHPDGENNGTEERNLAGPDPSWDTDHFSADRVAEDVAVRDPALSSKDGLQEKGR